MQQRGAYYVLTGDRSTGKTLVCTDLAAEGRARGLDVAGIITAPTGPELHAPRQVIDIRSGSARLFGVPSETGDDALTPQWSIDSDVFVWATEVLQAAVPCDLLIVDEIGPLELTGGRGWVSALEILRQGEFGAALAVCRPGLLTQLEASLGMPPAGVYHADPEENEQLPDLILAQMFGEASD